MLILRCKASSVLLPELHEDDTNWQKRECAHYFIYYRPGSPASENIEKICKDLDSCFLDVLEQLQVSFAAKIHYYLYNSKEDIEHNTHRDFPGFAAIEFESAAQIYDSKLDKLTAHETVHVVVYNTIGIYKLIFLNEGIAVAVERYHDRWTTGKLIIHKNCKSLLYQGTLFPLEVLVDNDRFKAIYHSTECNSYYNECGSFVRYLIDQYGLDKFKFLLPRAGGDNYRKVFQEIYGKSIDDFEKEWHEFLRNY